MISKEMAKAINEQVNKELFSAYLYLAMAGDAMDKGFKGVAHWMHVQAKEEAEHAERFIKYLFDQNARLELAAIEAPKGSWKDLKEMFGETLKHEQFITASIDGLGKIAKSQEDFATLEMLQWFFKEQVEEEGSAQDILWMLDMAAASKGALFQVDRQLGKRGAD
jgi:ferritin